MIPVKINSDDLSNLLWNKILENSYSKKIINFTQFQKAIDDLNLLRSQSTYNTGSITLTTAWLLYSLVYFFKPKTIVEVGSFIGKSTFSMAFAADDYSNEFMTEIFCCDFSNHITFPNLTKTKINQFHKKSSTEMLSSFNKDKSIDLLHIDGRLQPDDFSLLKDLINDQTIFVLDDFEGIEKGCINLINLYQSNLISKSKYLLASPIKELLKDKYQLYPKSTSAIVLPIKRLAFTSQ